MTLIITDPQDPNDSITPRNISASLLRDIINNHLITTNGIPGKKSVDNRLIVEIKDENSLWITHLNESEEHSRDQYNINLRITENYIIAYCTIPCEFANNLDPDNERLCPIIFGDDSAAMVDGLILTYINNFNFGRYTTKAMLILDEDGEQILLAKELLFERGLLIRSFTYEMMYFMEDCIAFLDAFDETFS
mgnify:CR=1 FL=1